MSLQPESIGSAATPALNELAASMQAQPATRPAPARTAQSAAVDRYTSQAQDSAQRAHDALLSAIRAFADRHQARTAAQREAEAKIARPPIAGSISAAQASISPQSVKLAVAVQSEPLPARDLAPLDEPWAPTTGAAPEPGSGAG
jgi:hypothetical protein